MAGTVDLRKVNPVEPHERTEDGCPGGWYRNGFTTSVARYVRQRIKGGGRVSNPFFDKADRVVQDCVMYLELQQERWHVHKDQCNYDAWVKANPPAKDKPSGARR